MKRTLVVGALVTLVAACSSGHSGTQSSVSTALTPSSTAVSGATITSLVVPASVPCGSATSTVVPVAYTVTGSAQRELVIDGLTGPPLVKPSGVVRAPVHCDDLEHTAVLVAVDPQGARITKTKTFATITDR